MVDVYPTLAALAGLADPITKQQHLNGTSLEPVFNDPTNVGVKQAAYSQFAKVGSCRSLAQLTHCSGPCLER